MRHSIRVILIRQSVAAIIKDRDLKNRIRVRGKSNLVCSLDYLSIKSLYRVDKEWFLENNTSTSLPTLVEML